jgi:hypothetical protein
MKASENVFVIWKFLAYTSPPPPPPPPPPPQLYMLATTLKLEYGIHYSFGIRNPRCGIRNPRSRIRNSSSGIRNPNTSWITSHGATLRSRSWSKLTCSSAIIAFLALSTTRLEVRQNMTNKQPCLRLFHAVMRSRKKAGNNEFNEC